MLRLKPWRAIRSGCAAAKRTTRAPAASRKYATVVDLASYPKPGEQLHGFTLRRKKHVPELQLTALELQHDISGAQYLHVARDDKNNVFSIGFKTNPPDHTGVPHILEHTTLCGSKRYPIRDPFFKMLPRSLSNFMNAFTSSDHTTYPFATTNHQDFKNLMSVYLDAALNPLLNENDFIQEGWRIGSIQQAAPDGSATHEPSLGFKGVVYNEMKGQMSDASYLFHIRFQQNILPELNNSGGDPQKMTDLTYADLKSFHKEHYHPGNAKIFTYGNLPLMNHLMELDRQLALLPGERTPLSIKGPVNLDNGSISHVEEGPVDPMLEATAQNKISISWLTGKTTDIVETFALGVLNSLLLDGYGSPLYRALIESGLGTDFSPNTGLDLSSGTGIFSVGLNGVKDADVLQFEGILRATLRKAVQEGFEDHKVNGLLHQLEVALKHQNANFGLDLMQRIEPDWFNGADVFDVLAWNEIVDGFKQRHAQGKYLESLVDKYFLTDRTYTFIMKASEMYADNLSQEEDSRLARKLETAAKEAGGRDAALKQIEEREQQLLHAQSANQDQDLSCLPSVHVQDIPRQREGQKSRELELDGVKLHLREATTNGLTYFRAVNLLPGLAEDVRMLLPIFTASIMRLGTKDKTVEELEDMIRLATGGISISHFATPSPLDFKKSTEGLSFSGYALDNNVPAMYDLLRTIIQEANFDGPAAEKQIHQLLQQEASGALDAIASGGHSYASRYAQAGLSQQGLINEQVSGLTQVQQMFGFANQSPGSDLGNVIEKLKKLQSIALSRSLRAAITCGSDAAAGNQNHLSTFLSQLPTACAIPGSRSDSPPLGLPSKTFIPLPYQVSYSGLALPTVPYTDPSGAPLQILSQLLTHKHLHHEIREKGGAYGGGASARSLSGFFTFYSYRDPNPEGAVKIMRQAGQWALDHSWTPQDLEEAKLSTFQGVDAPQSVSDEGMLRFLNGVDEDMEQRKREQLLDVTVEQVRDVADKYLVNGMKDARVAVIGPEEKGKWMKDESWTVKRMKLGAASEGDA